MKFTIKSAYLLLLFLMPIYGIGQVSDDFSDGDISASPAWQGDVIDFEVDGNLKLHLIGPEETDESHLSTESTAIENAQWDVTLTMDFSPSASNRTYIYLTSDVADLEGEVNGYYVIVGSTDDEVSLYRQMGSNSTKIIDGIDGVVDVDPVNISIRVTRDDAGNWELLRDLDNTGVFVSEGITVDETHLSSSYFGIRCDYTSTRHDLFYFDDIVVTGGVVSDNIAPEVSQLNVIDAQNLELVYTEAMDPSTTETNSAYDWMGNTPTQSILMDQTVLLSFSSPFPIFSEQELSISGVTDLAGNLLPDTTLPFTYIVVAQPASGDVIINEIMADPNPSVGLPEEVEYLELYNRSENAYELAGWQLVNSTSPVVLDSYLLLPGAYVILCDDSDTTLMSPYGDVLALSTLTALSNGGDDLKILSPDSVTIDAVTYTDSWYNDSERDGGGYSLERINPEIPCDLASNWRASVSELGGTPGYINAVYDDSPDTTAPELSELIYLSPLSIQLQFSEPLTEGSLTATDIVVSPSIEVEDIIAGSGGSYSVLWSTSMQEGIDYTITVSDVTDCSGNELLENSNEVVVPSAAEEGDIVINEILFRPRTGGSDFVELYNNSPRDLSLKDWAFSYLSTNPDTIIYRNISSSHLILRPGDFIALSIDIDDIVRDYPRAPRSALYEVNSLPTYSNDEGTVTLTQPDNTVHDQFYYNEDYHFALIDELAGVSLERIDYNRLTNDPTNWHSAAENVGWATPGYENSQLQPANPSSDAFTLNPDIFSPDSDGYQDVLNISYKLEEPGSVANISIYDRDGRIMRLLVRNSLLAREGTISWDGITDDGTKARIGVYIILIELFDLEGNTSSTKKSCVLGGRL